MNLTNLIAAVIVTVATNWVTVSRTTPVNPQTDGLTITLGMFYAMQNQVAYRVTNYVAVIEWKGQEKRFLLESHQSAEPCGTRSIPESPWIPVQ